MTSPDSDELSFRSLAGPLDKDTAEQLRTTWPSNPRSAGAHAGLRAALGSDALAAGTAQRQDPVNMRAALERLYAEIGGASSTVARDHTRVVSQTGTPRRHERSRGTPTAGARRWISAAAIAGAALVAAVSVVRLNVGTPASSSATTQTYTTTPGQRATIALPNGSHAVLAPATTMTVATASDGATHVTLTGQALFTVAHAAHTPFTVSTPYATTRVLGTTFMVRQYAAEPQARVAVADGRVSVQAGGSATNGRPVVLSARMVGVVGDSGTIHVAEEASADPYTTWTSGILVFQNTSVRDIVTELGRAYGVDIRLTDSTLSVRALTWTVPTQRLSLSAALDALAAVLDAHVTRRADTLIVAPGRAPLRPMRRSLSQETQYGR